MPEITPEHAKLIHAKYNKTQKTTSVIPNPHKDTWIDHTNPSEKKTDASAYIQKKEATESKVQEQGDGDKSPGEGRKESTASEPIIRPPTRAQDTFSLLQTPTAHMAGLPRQKFQYIATFRFTDDTTFNTIFKTDIDSQVEKNMNPDQDWDYPPDTSSESYKAGQNIVRQNVISNLRKSLMWNIKSIDGPKVNLQMDVLNQYNRKRNVYRRVEYDPVNVRFYDTMNSAAMNLWRYLYEHHVTDGRKKSRIYQNRETPQGDRSPYGKTNLSNEEDFITSHEYGISNESKFIDDYLIKSLDLFLIHGKKYTLIRFVHPRITAMDHDVFTYEASTPIEIGMQFMYETVLYETFNHPFDSETQDISVDLNETFKTSNMPDTPATEDYTSVTTEGEGSLQDNSYMTKMTGDTGLQDTTSASTAGSGTYLSSNSQRGDTTAINTKGGSSVFGSIMSGTPISNAISKISKDVYNATRGAVESFGKKIGTSGSAFSSLPNNGGKYNENSSKYIGKKSKNNVDSKNRIIKNANNNVERKTDIWV